MFSYAVAGLAFLLFFYNPIIQYLSPPSSSQQRRLPWTPRPRINESLLALDDPVDADEGVKVSECPPHAYSVHFLSKAPIVVYIENFISAEEREHLLEISEPLFEPSTITHDGNSTQRDATVRDSEVALIPRTETVRCVEERARALQGHRADLWLERLRTQRYRGPAGHYAHHFDWGSGARGWGRASSFMVWVEASEDIEGGGTEFPLLERWVSRGGGGGGGRAGKEGEDIWCKWVECGEETEEGKEGEEGEGGDGGVGSREKERKTGVTFRPIAGNAVFWENFRPDGTGRGWEETWHAGMPVTKGTKVGLNIWSWGRLI
ncbi:hypothetical protein F4778DRAFT_787753 [Xylariomycetidae sp. FL2044]|nr:hypothetical protein F4778DRAFT_787753 [Xylariomycetidae sp. FL2044]